MNRYDEEFTNALGDTAVFPELGIGPSQRPHRSNATPKAYAKATTCPSDTNAWATPVSAIIHFLPACWWRKAG